MLNIDINRGYNKIKTRTRICVRALFRSYKRAGDSLCT